MRRGKNGSIEPFPAAGRHWRASARRRNGRRAIPRKATRRKVKRAVRIQYAALPYRFTQAAALEMLLVTTRQTKRWIIPKGWPIKGLRPAKSAAREAFEEAGVRGKVSAKSVGLFTYDKVLDNDGILAALELRLNLGDGVNQAANLASSTTSIPSRNLAPLTAFGNWF